MTSWQFTKHPATLFFYILFLSFQVRSQVDESREGAKTCDCPAVFRPVCGSDNVTYDNLCVFSCAQKYKSNDLYLFHNDSCCPKLNCDNEVNLLCDNFGKTHDNECQFKHFQCVVQRTLGLFLKKLNDGPCPTKNCLTNCSEEYKPVCDKNGTIYRNICMFEKRKCELEVIREKIELADDNKCVDDKEPAKILGVETYSAYMDEVTLKYDEDVIVSTPATTSNSSNASLNFSDQKIFLRDSSSPEGLNRNCNIADCDKFWNPVCDSRNRTHKNICHFKFYACKVNKIDGSLVEISHLGPCLSHKNVCVSCPKDEKQIPVCDNKNMTHPSLCSFIQFNCNARNELADERVLVHIKPCHDRSPQFDLKDEVCPSKCSHDSKPVCDEANNTHQNLCHFQQYNCNMRKLGIRSPHLRYLRPCIKNKKLDTAVENIEIEMRATVSNVHVKPSSETTILPKSPTKVSSALSERTTFIVSTIERAPKVPTTVVTLPITSDIILSTTAKIVSTSFVPSSSIPTTVSTTTSTTTTKTVKVIEATTEIPTTTTTELAFFDCPKPNCPTESDPVCDSNGNLHENICEFTYSRCLAARSGEQLRISTEEKCVTLEACQMKCPEEINPVCASDFYTYDNLCQFRKQKCREPDLEVLFRGKCNDCLDSPCAIPADDAPDDSFVCVEDGSTKSLCEYQMLSCIFERGYGVNLTIQYIGKCCARNETCDTETLSPVCASNGITYSSTCELDAENCKLGKLELPKLEILINGTCEREMLSLEEELPISETHGITGLEFKRENTFNCSMECDRTYDPLCGTNSITYTNACSLQKEICDNENSTIEVAYTGMCCDTNCPNDFSPVCDSKRKTHQNICHFGIQRCVSERISGDLLTIENFGICNEVKECNFDCPKEYSPICASNGQTIINECELRKINCLISNNVTTQNVLSKDHDGECCREENCNYSAFSPVCDNEGVTHANECIMRKHACVQMRKFNKTIVINHKGQCCNQPCEDEIAPVCDGTKTHDNLCKFRIAQCEADRNNETLSIAYAGACCEVPDNDCTTSGAVCDSDGQTHENHCLYQKKKCIGDRLRGPRLNIVHTGECCALASCPKTGQPVCDSMGRSHDSLCHFHNSKCIFDKIHSQNTTLTLDYQGKCCPGGCTEELSVTCDQHGNVYRNTCYFNLKACETWRRTQDVLLATPCPLLRRI